jgi:hypothetical protein
MDYFSYYFTKSFESVTVKDIETYFKDQHTESNRTEFKSFKLGGDFNDSFKQIIKSICAFLNSEGGLIIWGAPQGTTSKNKAEKIFVGELTFINENLDHDKLINKISDSITPLPRGVSVRIIGDDNKYLYLFNIDASITKPHQFDNKYMIRLDGQSRIAPHYYIEAMFKQIKYPDIEGYIKFMDVRVINNKLIMDFASIIFNLSPLQNEKNVNILVYSPQGKFLHYNLFTNKIDKYHEYGTDGHQSLIRKLDDILFYGTPFINSDQLEFDFFYFGHGEEMELSLRFGGEYSPPKVSYYRFNFNNSDGKLFVNISTLYENKLVSETDTKEGSNMIDLIKKTIGR